MLDDIEIIIDSLDTLEDILTKMIDSTKLLIRILHQLTKQIMIYNNLMFKNEKHMKKTTVETIEHLWCEINYNMEHSQYDNINFYLVQDIYKISSDMFDFNNNIISIDQQTNYQDNTSFIYQLVSKNDGITGTDKIIFKYISNDCHYLEYIIQKFKDDFMISLFEKGIYLKINAGHYLKKGLIIFISVQCNRKITYIYKQDKIIIEIHKIITPDVIIKVHQDVNSNILRIEKLLKRLSKYQDYLVNHLINIKSLHIKYKSNNLDGNTNLQQQITNNNLNGITTIDQISNNEDENILTKLKRTFGFFD